MFGQFREKIQAVQQDLSDGIKSLSVKAQKVGKTNRNSETLSTKHDNLPSLRDGLHITAGADLLDNFQGNWTSIHQDLEDCAKRATETDVLIQQIALTQEKQFAEWRVIKKQLQEIPSLLEDIQNITTKIGKLTADFEEVEAALVDLEDVAEEEEYQRNEEIQRKELENYKKQKLQEEELLRARLQDQFNGKLLEKQKEEDVKMRERQQAFQEFFADDLKHYKEFGEMQRPMEVASQEAHLEDFELEWDEQDQQALNDFLGPPGPHEVNVGSNLAHPESPEKDKSEGISDEDVDEEEKEEEEVLEDKKDEDEVLLEEEDTPRMEEDRPGQEEDEAGEVLSPSEQKEQDNKVDTDRVVPGVTCDAVEETNSGNNGDSTEEGASEHKNKEDEETLMTFKMLLKTKNNWKI